MKIEGDMIIFKTGTRIYANRGIIGIEPNGTITEGYDGIIDQEDNEYHNNLTSSERIELAKYMINQWQKFMKNEKLGNKCAIGYQ